MWVGEEYVDFVYTSSRTVFCRNTSVTLHRIECVSEILWKKMFSFPLASWGRVMGGHTKIYQRYRRGWETIHATEGHPRCVVRMGLHIPTFRSEICSCEKFLLLITFTDFKLLFA